MLAGAPALMDPPRRTPGALRGAGAAERRLAGQAVLFRDTIVLLRRRMGGTAG